MKLKQIAPNQTELTLTNGDLVFFSYNTPVAARINYDYFKTSKKWSVTTSKHINGWLDGVKAEEKSQEFFENLLDKE